MLNLDPGKLLVIGVVAILVLGPDKLPAAARRVGETWTSFSEFRRRMESELRRSIPDLPATEDLMRLARSPSALLSHLSEAGVGADATTESEAEGAVVFAKNPGPLSASTPGSHQALDPDEPAVAIATVLGDANLN